MKQVEFTKDELVLLSTVLEDITEESQQGHTGGMYTGKTYLTPYTCYNMANILDKINKYLYDNPTIYKEAYNKYRKYQNSK